MSQLAVNGLTVRLTPDTSVDVEQFGARGQRAYVGEMRSDVRAHHRLFRVTTPMLATADMETLRSTLLGTQPLTVSGDLIGTDAECHARAVRIEPVTADAWIVSFELHESAALWWYFREVDGVLQMTDDPRVATHYLDTDAGGFFVTDVEADSDASLRYVRGEARMFVP